MSSNRNLVTFIARASDGLILVSSVDNTPGLDAPKNTAKRLIKNIRPSSPPKAFLESDGMLFYYQIEDGIIYLVFAEKNFPRGLLSVYASELTQSFGPEFGPVVPVYNRPYAAVSFEPSLTKIRRRCLDPSAAQNYARINSTLGDVVNLMADNLNVANQRGETLSRMEDKSSQMLSGARDFRKQSKYVNWMSMLQTYGPVIAIALVFLIVFYIKFLW